MPEGPSLVILKEQLQPFVGRTVTAAGGYAKVSKQWLKGQPLQEIRTWGKHLLLCFPKATIRIHLMLFGSVKINEKKKVNASIWFRFGKDTVYGYVVQVKMITEPLDDIYDWRTDIMSRSWSAKRVRSLVQEYPELWIGDLLLDQQVFTGVGNIIRNEVLFRAKLHPLSRVKDIPAKVMDTLLKEVKAYGKDFLLQKKNGTLSKNWQAYEQDTCPRDHIPFKKAMTGKTKRHTYYCNRCQERY